MKFFNKAETVSLIIIFALLVVVSWPNFALSLRRSRDQIRRDDIGNVQAAVDDYYSDYGVFPLSSPDGKIIACSPTGNISSMVPCNWGKDTWINLTPGVNKTYMKVIPGDPSYKKGVSYVYYSDGSRYQLLASLEGEEAEPGFDAKLKERGVACGSSVCNLGRHLNVPLYISIEEYNLQVYCSAHPKDIKCINRE